MKLNLHFKTLAGIFLLLLLSASQVLAQVKIGNNEADISPFALLELESSDKALLIPRMSTAQRDAAFTQDSPEGLVIFNTDLGKMQYFFRETDPVTGEKKTTKIWNSASEEVHTNYPVSAVGGDLYYNENTNIIYAWNPTAKLWIPINSAVRNEMGVTDPSTTASGTTASNTLEVLKEVLTGSGVPATDLLKESHAGMLYADYSSIGTLYVAVDNNKDGTPERWKAISSGGTTIQNLETTTNLIQTASGTINYVNEDGMTQTAQVVSQDANNALTVGTDSGAFLDPSALTDLYLGHRTHAHNTGATLAISEATHNLADIHLEAAAAGTPDFSINSADVTDGTTFFLTNTTASTGTVSFSGFDGAFLRNGGTIDNIAATGLSLKPNTRYLVHITQNSASGLFYFNATEAGGGLSEGTTANNTLRWDGSAWVESNALTNDGTDISVGGALSVTGTTTLNGALNDGTGTGTSGQLLSSTNTGIDWISIQDGIENWALANTYTANDVVIQNNKIYQANGAIAASTSFTIGTTGATWKEISKSANSVTNELSFEDAAGTYFYVSMLVDNAWKVIRYKLDDVNDEKIATVSNNSGQTAQPNTLALCEGLAYNL